MLVLLEHVYFHSFLVNLVSLLPVNVEGGGLPHVRDWSAEVAEEERRQSGYLTDSVLTGRGRGYRRGGRGRGRGGGGGYTSRDSGECVRVLCLWSCTWVVLPKSAECSCPACAC